MVGYNQVFPQVQAPNIANTLLQIRQLQNQDEDRQYRNALLKQKLDDRQTLRTALPNAMAGDTAAGAQVAAINPDLWMKLDANRREKVKRDVDLTGRLLYAVEQSPDKPTAYQAAIAAAKEQGVDVSKAPPQYDAGWVQSRMAEALSVADQIKLAESAKPQVVPTGGALVGPKGNVLYSNNGGGFGTSLDGRAISILINGDPSSQEYAAAYAHAAAPRTVQSDQGLVTVTPDVSWARPPARSGQAPAAAPATAPAAPDENSPAPTAPVAAPAQPGQPTVSIAQPKSNRVSFDDAAKLAGTKQSIGELDAVESELFKGGKLDRSLIFTSQKVGPVEGVPFTEGRDVRQRFRRAIEVLLRLRTGAAAPDSEVTNYMNLYFPQPGDSDAAAKAKFKAAREFFGGVLREYGQGRPAVAAENKARDASSSSAAQGLPDLPPGFEVVN